MLCPNSSSASGAALLLLEERYDTALSTIMSSLDFFSAFRFFAKGLLVDLGAGNSVSSSLVSSLMVLIVSLYISSVSSREFSSDSGMS